MHHRHLLRGILATAALGFATLAHAASGFPERSPRLVVGFPPGSATDVVSRVVANQAGEQLGHSIVVENRPGASSTIAARAVAAADPDGYTLFIASIANAINANSKGPGAFDMENAFAPVAFFGGVPIVLVVHPSLGVDSLDKLIALGKSKPGTLQYASSGVGTAPHLAGLLFNTRAGLKMLHVPYKGSADAMSDLLAGRVNVMFSPASTVKAHVDSGRLIGIGSASATRMASAPDLPTLGELGLKDFESSVWMGVVTHKNTPAEVRNRLTAAFNDALAADTVKAQLAKQGVEVRIIEPEAFGNYMRQETEKWGDVMREAGVTLN